MTTELKQEAQQSTLCLQAVCRYISDVLAGDASSSEKHIARTIMHLLPLEQAVPIQQAEAQQPAAGEPVVVQHRKPVIGWKGETIGYTAWMDGKGLDGWPHRELYDRPAPSVPGDDFDLICNAIDKADTITMEGDYMLDSDDCIAVVRVMQALLSAHHGITAQAKKEDA